MDPLGMSDDTKEEEVMIASATTANPLLMSEFDKKSLRLIGTLVVSGFIILLILYCWAREFFRRNLGFGSKVFKARKKNKQKWKKIN